MCDHIISYSSAPFNYNVMVFKHSLCHTITAISCDICCHLMLMMLMAFTPSDLYWIYLNVSSDVHFPEQKNSAVQLSQVQYCIKIKRKGTKGQNSDLLESSNQECLYSTMLGWCKPWWSKAANKWRNSQHNGQSYVNKYVSYVSVYILYYVHVQYWLILREFLGRAPFC